MRIQGVKRGPTVQHMSKKKPQHRLEGVLPFSKVHLRVWVSKKGKTHATSEECWMIVHHLAVVESEGFCDFLNTWYGNLYANMRILLFPGIWILDRGTTRWIFGSGSGSNDRYQVWIGFGRITIYNTSIYVYMYNIWPKQPDWTMWIFAANWFALVGTEAKSNKRHCWGW